MVRLFLSPTLLLSLFVVLSPAAYSQGRFESQKRRGFAFVREALDPASLSSPERFDKAGGELTPVWEQERPPDPEVAENLAIAYLNGERRRYDASLQDKALALMEKSIELSGSATFLVHHRHDKLGFIQGSVKSNYCSGKLTVRPGRLVYLSLFGDKATEHSFDINPGEVKQLEKTRDMLRVEFLGKNGKPQGYHLFPRTQLERDATLLSEFISRHFRQTAQ